jgi:hypothetical protein
MFKQYKSNLSYEYYGAVKQLIVYDRGQRLFFDDVLSYQIDDYLNEVLEDRKTDYGYQFLQQK